MQLSEANPAEKLIKEGVTQMQNIWLKRRKAKLMERTEYYNEIATEWRCEDFKLSLIRQLSGIPQDW